MAGDDQKGGPRLPSIEEEFADLDRELKRIAGLPLETPEQRNAVLLALQGMRAQLDESVRNRADAPVWRRAVDTSLMRALDGIMTDIGREGNSDGQFRIEPGMLKKHLEPVFLELSAGLQRNFVEKFRKPQAPGAPPVQVDAADVAAMLLTLFGPQKKK